VDASQVSTLLRRVSVGNHHNLQHVMQRTTTIAEALRTYETDISTNRGRIKDAKARRRLDSDFIRDAEAKLAKDKKQAAALRECLQSDPYLRVSNVASHSHVQN
jgi:hypothetical protein